MTLPYFNMRMNQFRVGSLGFVSAMYAGSFVLSVFSGELNQSEFTLPWTMAAVGIAGTGACLPLLRWRGIRLRLLSMRPAMLQELEEAHVAVPGHMFSPRGGGNTLARTVSMDERLTKYWARRIQRASIVALATRIRDTKLQEQCQPLSLLGESEDDTPRQCRESCFTGMAAYEVELVVRAELAMEDNGVRRGQPCCNTKRVLPTSQAVEHVMWLFVQAIDEFVTRLLVGGAH